MKSPISIPCGHGIFTLVDFDDALEVLMHSWTVDGVGYPYTKINGKTVNLHKLLLPNVSRVDHVDRNKLNNQRHNLRETTRSLNAHNTDVSTSNRSGYKGISYIARDDCWSAEICINRVRTRKSGFKTLQAAVEYRKKLEGKVGVY